MTMKAFLLVGFIAAVSVPSVEGAEAKAVEAKPNDAAVPAPRIDGWWLIRQGEKIDLMAKANGAEKAKKPEDEIDLLMVGDSITHNFENEKVGLKVWQKYFVPLKAINLGFGGDRTQHVLWRLDHLPELKKAPKAAVVMIGTNNMGWGSDTPEQTSGGIRAIVVKLKELYPDMDVLVLGIFPRRQNLDHPHRKRINQLNAMMPGLLKGLEGVTDKPYGLFYSHGGGGRVVEPMEKLFARLGTQVGQSIESCGKPDEKTLAACRELGKQLTEATGN